MLRMTGVKLKQISEIDKYLFVEKGLRGRVSQFSKRYTKANDKYTKIYDPKKASTFVNYLYTNNLYGWVMSEYLPYGQFK